MASSPYFLVSFITMVIIYPMSVSLLKYEFQEGGVCVLFFSVALPASSFRNRFPNGLQPGPARITQPQILPRRSLLLSPLLYLWEKALRGLWSCWQLLSPDRHTARVYGTVRRGQEGTNKSHGNGKWSFSKHLTKFSPHSGSGDCTGLSSWELVIRDVCLPIKRIPLSLLVCTAVFRESSSWILYWQ